MYKVPETFRALVADRNGDTFSTNIRSLNIADLPAGGELLVNVAFSSVNYKDALAISDSGPIIRGEFPFVPGIDLAGTVIESSDDRFHPGDRIIGTGGGLGETAWGGYSEYQRISSRWIVHLPRQMTFEEAMAIGTAGVTAMLSLLTIQEQGVETDSGEILVTGATGGVGSIAVKLLSEAGYRVVACTGKMEEEKYLRSLGATRIMNRREYDSGPIRPMARARWAGAVDNAGSTFLARILSETDRHGVVASCGLAAGSDLNTTVFPFILRGVRLIGIDSNTCPVALREKVWRRFAESENLAHFSDLSTVVTLEELQALSKQFMDGRIRGRYIVRVSGNAM